MKNLKLIGAFLSLIFFQGQAQNPAYKVAFSGVGKQLEIKTGTPKLKITGYAGKEVIIETEMKDVNRPEEAEGLKLVTPGMKTDNTGHGANVEIVGDVMKIKIPKSKYYGTYVIKVPAEVDLTLRESGNPYASWLIENMNGEVDLKSTYTNVFIKEVSGPIVADGGYGNMDIVYAKLDQKRPNSISGLKNVNITLPADSKANLRMDSNYGDVFTDFNLENLEPEKDEEKDEDDEEDEKPNSRHFDRTPSPARPPKPVKPVGAVAISPKKVITTGSGSGSSSISISSTEGKDDDVQEFVDKVEKDVAKGKYNYSYHIDSEEDDDCGCDPKVSVAKINGGGVNLKVHSSYGNVYLRKKK